MAENPDYIINVLDGVMEDVERLLAKGSSVHKQTESWGRAEMLVREWKARGSPRGAEQTDLN